MSLGAYLLDALQAEDVQRHTSNEGCLLVLFTHTQTPPKGVRLKFGAQEMDWMDWGCTERGLDKST